MTPTTPPARSADTPLRATAGDDRRFRIRVASAIREAPGPRALRTRDDLERLFEGAERLRAGRGGQLRVEAPGWPGALRIRPARRGGLLGPLLGDRHARPDRILGELTVWEALGAAGVPTPEPGFAAAWRAGLGWRGVFASREHPEAVDGLRFLRRERDPARLVGAARAAGESVRRLHDSGHLHGDLHLENLLFETPAARPGDAAPFCLLVDFDHARRVGELTPELRLREGLRLWRSVEKHALGATVSREIRDAAIDAYCGRDAALRQRLAALWPHARRRLWRHRFAWTLARGLRVLRERGAASAGGASLWLLLAASLAALVGGCGDRGPSEALAPVEGARRSLLAVGDTGRNRALPALFEGQRAVADAMRREADRAPVDALVLLGDNFYPDGLTREALLPRLRANLVTPYCVFLRLAGPRSAEVADACPVPPAERRPVPLYAVLGNHDLEVPESAGLQRTEIAAFLPGWHMSRGLAETVELGDGLSLVLFESEPAIDDPAAIGEALRAAIERARGPWRILATHRPIATDDDGRPRLGGYPTFVRDAILASGRPVQLVLAGHHHSLQAFAVGPPLPSLQLGIGSGARAEPPLAAADHPEIRFARLALGFARIDLVGHGENERLVATLHRAPDWPILARFDPPRAIARFAVDRAGRVTPAASAPP